MQSAGNHNHNYNTRRGEIRKNDDDKDSHVNDGTSRQRTDLGGEHIHNASITGGDSETRPSNVSVYFYIKVDSG